MPTPNNIMIDEFKIAVFCITKAANGAIKTAFMKALGATDLSNPHDPSHFTYAGKEKIALLPDDWFTFTIVRNPYDRMVSLWANKCRDYHHIIFARHGVGPFDNFTDFAEAISKQQNFDIHWESQYETLVLDGEMVPKHLYKYERLGEVWKFIQAQCAGQGLGVPDLEVRNESSHKPWEDYYTPETRKLIYNRYRKDFETFGYAA